MSNDLSDGLYAEATPCFMCLFTQVRSHAEKHEPCVVKHLKGHLISARERSVNGKPIPYITLDLGTTFASIALDADYYRDFVRDLLARGNAVPRLPVHVYHLPAPISTTEYKGKLLYHYRATQHTLAVLDPDTLLNITDLSQADYCNRQYLLDRLASSPSTSATVMGNLIHRCFTELLKENDTSRRTVASDNEVQKTPLATLKASFAKALDRSKMEIALANASLETVHTEASPHLESLAAWYEHNRNTLWGGANAVRAETFLLVPEIGLRGRLDLYWEQGISQSLLELKTGGAAGDLPRSGHRRQVYGYQALLAVRQNSKLQKAEAKLLYSGTPGEASLFPIRFNIRDMQRINATRNTLVLMHITGTPPAPPGERRCTKCSMLTICERVSSLLDWQPPQPSIDVVSENMDVSPAAGQRRTMDDTEDRTFFAKYYHLLQLEGRAGEQELAALWQTPGDERVLQGKTIQALTAQSAYEETNDGWQRTFSYENQGDSQPRNQPELREGDEILLSDGDPIKGEVVTGTLTSISSKEVTVWTRERIDTPTRIDAYDNDLVHVRTLQNLLRWLDVEPHLRDLVAARVRPRFVGVDVPQRADFNAQQNEAVERAVQMQDYLLIQGPPGTGKTSVIAEIVKRLTQQGQRVLLAAFTNQAVDNMLKRLDTEGMHEYIRLGHERSVDKAVKDRLLKEWVEVSLPGHEDAFDTDTVRAILTKMPIVASTTATWSSDKYVPQTLEAYGAAPLQFDVAIIDEASQLTVPAILGALRFAKRFILVGDDKQLPPLVLSEKAAEQGLAASLFDELKARDKRYCESHTAPVSACVSLTTQYRMNRWISNFSSTVFYDKQLVPHESIANRRLDFSSSPGTGIRSMGAQKVLEGQLPSVAQAITPDFPLVFLDVRSEADRGAAKISNAEAQAVRDVVAGLLAHGIEEKGIGVIAPFRAQVATIRRSLFTSDETSGWEGLSTDAQLTIDTVDRFQGGERAVIIMSFATTSAPTGERRDFLTNPNRLNVALTRAQRKLIVVGCVPALESLPIFERLIKYCRSMKTLIAYEAPIAATR